MMQQRDAHFIKLACGLLTFVLATTTIRLGADEPEKKPACPCKSAETEVEFTLVPGASKLLKFLPLGVPHFESSATWSFSASDACQHAACEKASQAECLACPAKSSESQRTASRPAKCVVCDVVVTTCPSAQGACKVAAGTCQAPGKACTATCGKTNVAANGNVAANVCPSACKTTDVATNSCPAQCDTSKCGTCNTCGKTDVAAYGCPFACKTTDVATNSCPAQCDASTNVAEVCPSACGTCNIAVSNRPSKCECDVASRCEDACDQGNCPITNLGPPPEMFEFTFEGNTPTVDAECCPFAHGKCPVLHGIGAQVATISSQPTDKKQAKKLKRKLAKMRATVVEMAAQARIAEVQRKAMEREHELQRQLATVTVHGQYQQQIANIQASQMKMQQQWLATIANRGAFQAAAPAPHAAQLQALAEENARLRARLAQLESAKTSY